MFSAHGLTISYHHNINGMGERGAELQDFINVSSRFEPEDPQSLMFKQNNLNFKREVGGYTHSK